MRLIGFETVQGRVKVFGSSRVAHPLADVTGKMGAVADGDDAGLVDQFLQNHHVARRLEDLIVAAVPAADAVPPREMQRVQTVRSS